VANKYYIGYIVNRQRIANVSSKLIKSDFTINESFWYELEL